jgi:eukaryotic-like serine/threonine-protein kinase
MTEHELAGRTIAGRYDLLALLGAGGMGAVYRAHDRELDELVALKVIRAELARSPVMVDRFRHEVKLARRVTHVNIARTFELGHADGVMYCTMQLVEGESLRQRLARERKLGVGEAAAIARELCDGLAAAHAAEVIHRDIKPDNVLLAAGGRVVLADFGVAAIGEGAHTRELSGTPEYMAPEQARGEPPTPACDVYAVGVLLYEMLTGLRAFSGELADILVAKQEVLRLDAPPHSMPLDLAQVIGRATAREPAERIASAAELGRLLAPWTASVHTPATAAPRRPAGPGDLHTVVVVPPTGEVERMHIAEGVHEELLRRLVRRPRMRVLPRPDGAPVPDATVVELYAAELLSATIRRGGARTTLHLPLDVGSLGIAADAIASAVAEAVGQRAAGPDPAAQALDMRLRARMLAQRSFLGVPPALELLEQAHALCPDDPRIAAALAMQCVRFAVVDTVGEDAFGRSRALVRAALAAAPELAESHVAAGHLELHTGDAALAASHFRTAIACSPYVAEAHEGLGRMLLEAGFLDVAMARLDDALAISPNLASVRWEIARAHALEGDWATYDRLVAELAAQNDRQVARLRIAWWRGDLAAVAALQGALLGLRGFEPTFMARITKVMLQRTWPEHRDELLAHAASASSPSLRRRSFLAQLGAEAAGYSGDVRACLAMIEHAVGCGLYDQHWLARCPLLEPVRHTAEYARLRGDVKRRAESILDALYGDGKALSDTLVG